MVECGRYGRMGRSDGVYYEELPAVVRGEGRRLERSSREAEQKAVFRAFCSGQHAGKKAGELAKGEYKDSGSGEERGGGAGDDGFQRLWEAGLAGVGERAVRGEGGAALGHGLCGGV